jgi:hypothetical protein
VIAKIRGVERAPRYLNVYPPLALSCPPRLQRQPGRIPTVEELQTLPPGRAAPPQRRTNVFPREEGRLDGRHIVARDIVRRIPALKNDLEGPQGQSFDGPPCRIFGRVSESVERIIGIEDTASIRKINECDVQWRALTALSHRT